MMDSVETLENENKILREKNHALRADMAKDPALAEVDKLRAKIVRLESSRNVGKSAIESAQAMVESYEADAAAARAEMASLRELASGNQALAVKQTETITALRSELALVVEQHTTLADQKDEALTGLATARALLRRCVEERDHLSGELLGEISDALPEEGA